MASRSVRDGSVPQWMKTKTENSISLDDLAAQSPPAQDEPFFHIRLPIAKRRPLQDRSSDSDLLSSNNLTLENDITSVKAPGVDLSKECKKYYGSSSDINVAAKSVITKPKGTDDDFKTAACAGSLVQVAQKFVGGKQLSKRFTIAKIEEHDDLAHQNDEDEDKLQTDPNLMHRRNSRSLPTSPSSSPKAMRKFQPQPNPYFTINGSEAQPPKQSWFLTSLFGVRRELTTSTMSVSSQIDEAEEVIESSTTSQVVPQNSTSASRAPPSNIAEQQRPAMKKVATTEAKPQPTMLREMNFWAPTSH